MGFFNKQKKSKPIENTDKSVTVDLSVERGFQIAVSEDLEIEIGKLHHIGRRSEQQDAFGVSEVSSKLLDEKGVLLVLADGMGGMADGATASTTAVISCLQHFDGYTEQGDSEYSIWAKNTIKDASDEVYGALGAAAGKGGSTLLLVRYYDQAIDWASVGDSHIYLFRDGVLTQLNHEHIYANKLDIMAANDIITVEQAMNDPMRRALTSFVGQKEVESIELSNEPLYLEEGDYILMMSDGIFGTLSESEMISAIDPDSVGKTALRLGMMVEAKMVSNQDNYTGLFMKIK